MLGATGDTGKPLLKKALENGHQITAIVRDASKIAEKHHNLNVIQADIFNFEDLAPIFKGQDAILSVLGFPKQIERKMTKFTDSMEAILKAMKMAEIKRIVTISAWYTNRQTRQGQYMFDNMWSKVPGLVNTLDNEGEMDQILAQSEFDFTSVLVPTLTWDPETQKEILTEEGKTWVENGSGLMTREDVARFMLKVVENESFKRKAVAVSVKYSQQEFNEALERMKKHMAQYIK